MASGGPQAALPLAAEAAQLAEEIRGYGVALPVSRVHVPGELQWLLPLYKPFRWMLQQMAERCVQPVVEFDVDSCVADLQSWVVDAFILPEESKKLPAYRVLRTQLADWIDAMHLLKPLQSPNFLRAHLEELCALAGQPPPAGKEAFTVQMFLDLQPTAAHRPAVEKVTRAAAQQVHMNTVLQATYDFLHNTPIPLDRDEEGPVLVEAGCPTLLEELEDHHCHLDELMADPYSNTLRPRLSQARADVSHVADLLRRLCTAQTHSAKLRPVMGVLTVARRIDRSGRFAPAVAALRQTLQDLATGANKLAALAEAHSCLTDTTLPLLRCFDHIQQELTEYLREKQEHCPRLYFLPEADLLALLCTTDLSATLPPLLPRLFPAVRRFRVRDGLGVGADGATVEVVNFAAPCALPASGLDSVIVLHLSLQDRMRRLLGEAVAELQPLLATGAGPLPQDLLERFPAQILTCVLRLIWTDWVEGSLPRGLGGSGGPSPAEGAPLASLARLRLLASSGEAALPEQGLDEPRRDGLSTSPPLSPNFRDGLRRPTSPAFARMHSTTSLSPEFSFRTTMRRDSGPRCLGPWGALMQVGRPLRPSSATYRAMALASRDAAPSVARQTSYRSSVRAGPAEVGQRLARLGGQLRALLRAPGLPAARRRAVDRLVVDFQQLQERGGHVARQPPSAAGTAWHFQLRHYWDPERGRCSLAIGGYTLDYGAEWLPPAPAAFLGPATDTAFLALAQALHFGRLGVAAGPHHSGRTETLRQLAFLAGRWLVPVEAAEAAPGPLLGCAGAAAWLLLRDLHRLPPAALGALAEAVAPFLAAAAAAAAAQHATLPNPPCRVAAGFGFLATTLPLDAAQLQAIPPALRSRLQFTGVEAPPLEFAIRVRLAAWGCSTGGAVAKKLASLLHLCSTQLSAQPHYRWDCRFVCQAILEAGPGPGQDADSDGLQRDATPACHAVQQAIARQLVPEDAALLPELLRCLFPNHTPPAPQYLRLEQALDQHLAKAGLSAGRLWRQRVLQLYGLPAHGPTPCLLGPAGSGKTAAWEALRAALGHALATRIEAVRLNLGAATAEQVFSLSPPGLLPLLWQRFTAAPGGDARWLVFDGPLPEAALPYLAAADPALAWAAEITPLGVGQRLWLEMDRLDHSSPAVVTRTQLLVFHPTDLGWPAVVARQRHRAAAHAEHPFLRHLDEAWGDLLARHVAAAHDVLGQSHATAPPRVTHCVERLLALLRALSPEVHPPPDPDARVDCLAAPFWLALAWAFAGALDGTARDRFSAAVVQPHCPALPGSVFDHVADLHTGSWRPWSSLVEQTGARPVDVHSFLPSADMARYLYLLRLSLKQGRSVLVTGEPGSGVTTLMTELVDSLPECTSTAFHAHVSPFFVQQLVAHLAPAKGRRHVLFVDDLHRPLLGPDGGQPIFELLYQAVAPGRYWTAQHGHPAEAQYDVTLLAAASPEPPLPPRLRLRMDEYRVEAPRPASLEEMYGVLLYARCPVAEVPEDTLAVLLNLPRWTAGLLEMHTQQLSDTAPEHCRASLACVGRALQGLLLLPREVLLRDPDTLLAAWRAECRRSFLDRLPSPARTRLSAAAEAYGCGPLAGADPPLFVVPGPAGGRMLLAKEDVGNYFDGVLDALNRAVPDRQPPLRLPAALQGLVLRLLRVLALPGGHALLVAPRGHGRETAAHLAMYALLGAPAGRWVADVRDACVAGDAGAFRRTLAAAHTAAHLGADAVLCLRLDALPDDGWLEEVHSLLAAGRVPGLLERSYAAQDKLHFIFSMTAGEAARLLPRYPALRHQCEVIRVEPWPETALEAVATQALAPLALPPQALEALAVAAAHVARLPTLPAGCPLPAYHRLLGQVARVLAADLGHLDEEEASDAAYLAAIRCLGPLEDGLPPEEEGDPPPEDKEHLTAVHAEAARVKRRVQRRRRRRALAPGNALLAAAYLEFGGPLGPARRLALLAALRAALEAGPLKHAVADVRDALRVAAGSPHAFAQRVMRWATLGVSLDPQSLANLFLLSDPAASPLLGILDPDGCGEEALRRLMPGLAVVPAGSPAFPRRLMAAMAQGRPLLARLPAPAPATLAALRAPVLGAAGGWAVLPGCPKPCPWRPGFRLILLLTAADALPVEFQGRFQTVHWAACHAFAGLNLRSRLWNLSHGPQTRDTLAELAAAVVAVQGQLEGELAVVAQLLETSGPVPVVLCSEAVLGVAPQLMGWSQQLHRSMAAVEREVEGLLQWGEEEEGEPDAAGALATLWRSVQDIGAVDAACQVRYGEFLSLCGSLAAAPKGTEGQLVDRVASVLVYRLPDRMRLLLGFLHAVRLADAGSPLPPLTLLAMLRGPQVLHDLSAGLPPVSPTGKRFSKRLVRPEWLPAELWQDLCLAAHCVPSLAELPRGVTFKTKTWRAWWSAHRLEARILDLERPTREDRLLINRTLRPDRTPQALLHYVHRSFAERVHGLLDEPPRQSLRAAWALSTPGLPVVVLQPPGVDLYPEFLAMPKPLGRARKRTLEIAITTYNLQEYDTETEARLALALPEHRAQGDCVLLRGWHPGYGPLLRLSLAAMQVAAAPDHRLVLMMAAEDLGRLPAEVREAALLCHILPASSLQQRLQLQCSLAAAHPSTAELQGEWLRACFGLLWLSAVLAQRSAAASRVPRCAGNPPAEAAALCLALEHLLAAHARPGGVPPVPWERLRRLAVPLLNAASTPSREESAAVAAAAELILNGEVLQPGVPLYGGFAVPDLPWRPALAEAAALLPPIESPTVVGLHRNVQRASLQRLARWLCDTSTALLCADLFPPPPTPSPPSSADVLDRLPSVLSTLLAKWPAGWPDDTVRRLLATRTAEGPLRRLLIAEVAALHRVLRHTRRQLEELAAISAADASVALQCPTQRELALCLLTSRLPPGWAAEWAAPSAFAWADGLAARHRQLTRWLAGPLPAPLWLGGLRQPALLLPALRLQAAAQDGHTVAGELDWTADDVALRLDICDAPAAGELPAPRPPQAFLVRGLATDAFCWAPETRVIQELPEPTGGYVASSVAELPLFCAVPVRASAEAGNRFLCPIYDTVERTALIAYASLPCHEAPAHWVLRGAALYSR